MQAPLSLLCLPCAGASATMYLRWRRRLPHWIEVVPMELPGRGSRLGEDFVEDFESLVSLLCAEHDAALRGNFALFGHSMGALLAWGVAQRLRADGRPLPRALLVSGSAAPSQRDPDRFVDMNDDAALVGDLRRQGGTPEELFDSPELLRMTLDTLAADYRVCESFAHAGNAPLPLPLHAFSGRQDDIEPWRMEAWSAETSRAGFTLDWFDGGHFFIRQQEARVLEALVQRLAGLAAGAEVHAPRARALA
ncbi:alpha/beta fold hydrolase [Variovorax guangxiensis]|uniref:Alpha/beta fold hydrolase n=1 Tax=Variovorax guangxiensis TaxID=1775474 RepID=A0A3S0ZIW9_9BURK|nr:alpha/beta fold hydrolase [Variovorax guangxiensis]RUR71208.1 alpha/beta fold hydrolase [Variovorax guangxiensis]